MADISNREISAYLDERGILHSVSGFKYLMLSLRVMLDGKADRYRMASVYDEVAAQTGVKAGYISHSIRDAIRKTPDPVPNKEFLSRAYDDLMLAADANANTFAACRDTAGTNKKEVF